MPGLIYTQFDNDTELTASVGPNVTFSGDGDICWAGQCSGDFLRFVGDDQIASFQGTGGGMDILADQGQGLSLEVQTEVPTTLTVEDFRSDLTGHIYLDAATHVPTYTLTSDGSSNGTLLVSGSARIDFVSDHHITAAQITAGAAHLDSA